MGVYEYQGEPGLGCLRLACAHGTAPVTNLKQGDLVDFGEHEPPADGRWIEAPEGTEATRLPDNHPVVQYPEPDPEDAGPQDAEVEPEAAPTDETPVPRTPPGTFPASAEPTKRSKPAAKTTA
jgi:hypothetical protein